jgi:hypothetical protein
MKTAEYYVPPGVYKVVCKGQKLITSKSGFKGIEVLFEIVKPLKSKGQMIRHVFWITERNLVYVHRDAIVILGRRPRYLETLARRANWIGKTCEVGVWDETFRGIKASRVRFFNSWKPKKRSAGGSHA